jgi:putative SOS response-associated peptidase YedK
LYRSTFSEFNKVEGGDIWFALDETRPLACFAGIWTNWTSVRKDHQLHLRFPVDGSERRGRRDSPEGYAP